MNKFEVINEIIRLYDLIESNYKEKEIALAKKEITHDDVINELKRKIYNVGVEKLLDDCVISWKRPYVNADGIAESFVVWSDESICDLPDWISKKDFIDLFYDRLIEIYDTRCESAMNDWKNKHESKSI